MIQVSTELHQIRTPFDPRRPFPCPNRWRPARSTAVAPSAGLGASIESSQSLMSPDGIGPKQMDRQVDVVVVGAGPTGSTAAKYAALGGADVLLVEKRSEIGAPVGRGEGVAKRGPGEVGRTASGGGS